MKPQATAQRRLHHDVHGHAEGLTGPRNLRQCLPRVLGDSHEHRQDLDAVPEQREVVRVGVAGPLVHVERAQPRVREGGAQGGEAGWPVCRRHPSDGLDEHHAKHLDLLDVRKRN